MAIKKIKNIIQRVFNMTWDMEYIQNAIYNQSTGAQKGISVEPVVKSVYIANTQIEFGSYIKVAAGTTAYTMDCVGKAYDTAYEHYRRGDVVTNGGFVYVANQDFQSGIAAGAFDANKWTKVASKTIAAIPVSGGQTISTGKYHNAVNVNGFLVDDETSISKVE